MLLFCRWLLVLSIALALAGCSTVEEPSPTPLPSAPTPAPLPTPAQPPQSRPATNRTPTLYKTNTVPVTGIPAPTNTNPPSRLDTVSNLVIAPSNPATTPAQPTRPYVRTEPHREWIDMQRWSITNGSCQLRQSTGGSMPRFTLHSPRGEIDFTINSQIAHWNGVAFMLSYSPEMDNGKPHVHSLDLANSITPLTRDFRWPSSGTRVLVIDPGHGGDQPGSQTVVGDRWEKELTLDWALRVQAGFASRDTNHTWKVFLTHTNDVDVALSNRVAIADRLCADLFISLHFNSFSNPEQIGIETYCLTPAGMPSNLTRGPEDDLPQPNNSYDPANLYWAMRLHNELIRTTHAPDRAVRRARFMAVLRNQKRPAILIEGGYLSNRKEARLIISENYRQKLADAVVEAVLNP